MVNMYANENKEQRVVRVFLSSSFLDMQLERETIRKKVEKELDEFCNQRGVHLSFIDMRWGMTKEGKDEDTILCCLREVDHCRPYFVGLLGQNYGWHQELDGKNELLTKSFERAEKCAEYKWIHQFRTRSVTELQILHGFLLHPFQPTNHCFFYFRDPSYIQTLEVSQHKNFQDSSSYAIERMTDLKDRIQKGNASKVTEYITPKELGDLLLLDLKNSIENDFPLSSIKELSLAKKMRSKHKNYAREKCAMSVESKGLLEQLDQLLAGVSGRGVAIVAETGKDNSSLIANWWKRAEKSDAILTFCHFVGASWSATELSSILLRMVLEFKEYLNEDTKEINCNEKVLAGLLPGLFSQVSSRGQVVIMIDAVNQLSNTRDHNLWWIPSPLPDGVKVVVSSVAGTAIDEASKRGWRQNFGSR